MLPRRLKVVDPEDDRSNHFIPLVGYSLQERYKELKDSFKIKTKNFEKLCSENAETKKLLEDVVLMLKTENKKLKSMLRYFNRDTGSYLYLFPDRESKLKYAHKTPETMKESLTCKLGHKKNVLNLLICRQKKLLELGKELDREIIFLDQVCGNAKLDDQITDDIVRNQKEIEYLLNKARTNSFIKSSYVPILSILRTELFYFPIRIKNAEKALKYNLKELEEIKAMDKQAKDSKHLSYKKLKQLQEDMAKDRKERGEALNTMKRNMGQRLDAFDKMRKRKLTMSGTCSDVAYEYRVQLNKTRLNRFKINDLFGSIKSTLLETRIMNACQTMLNNDEMNQYQTDRKGQVDKKYKNMQKQIKQAQLTKVKMVQSNSNNREKYRRATSEFEVKVKVLETQIVEKKKKLRSDGDLLMNIKKGVCALGSKLCWIDLPDLREEKSVSEVIININLRLARLLEMNEDNLKTLNQQEMRQDYCLSKLLSKNVALRALSEEEQTRANEMATTFEDVLEINDNTPMVRNYMKTTSKRLVMRQKKKK